MLTDIQTDTQTRKHWTGNNKGLIDNGRILHSQGSHSNVSIKQSGLFRTSDAKISDHFSTISGSKTRHHNALQRLLYATNNKCIATDVLAKLIFQDHSGQKPRLFSQPIAYFRNSTGPRFSFSLFRTLQDWLCIDNKLTRDH